MQYRITAPADIHTTIQIPASKSISNRALIINALSDGAYIPSNLSDCDDTQVMIQALNNAQEIIDIHAAGTAMRFLTAYLSIAQGTHVLTGTERMRHRPIKVLVEALRTLGAEITYMEEEGFPPLRITGKASDAWQNVIELPGNISSQYISALLMIGPCLKHGLTIKLTNNVISKPYINLTLALMREYGAQADWLGESLLIVKPQPYQSVPFMVESDWSAASYWYEVVALSASKETAVTLPGLFKGSHQGDSEVAWIFEQLGIETHYDDHAVTIRRRCDSPAHFEYNFVNQPDLAQTLVVTCIALNIPFRFNGLQSLKIKETDRIAALIHETQKLGYVLKEDMSSTLYWKGDRCEASMEAIDTYEDHRMAMAFAPACLSFSQLRINHPEVVSKSYPRYWDDLRQAGFTIEEQ